MTIELFLEFIESISRWFIIMIVAIIVTFYFSFDSYHWFFNEDRRIKDSKNVLKKIIIYFYLLKI